MVVQELKLKFRSSSVQYPSAEEGGEEGRNKKPHTFYSSDPAALFIQAGPRHLDPFLAACVLICLVDVWWLLN